MSSAAARRWRAGRRLKREAAAFGTALHVATGPSHRSELIALAAREQDPHRAPGNAVGPAGSAVGSGRDRTGPPRVVATATVCCTPSAPAPPRPVTHRLDRDAIGDALPLLAGLIPFGLLIGVTIGQVGLNPGVGLGSAALFFGGSAHLTALLLIGAGAGPVAVISAVVIVNSRLMLYGAALYPHFRDQPRWFRWLAPHLIFDHSYAIAVARPELVESSRFRRYWLTVGAVITVGWLTSHVVGLLVGSVLPQHSVLDIAAPAVFVGLLVPQLARRLAVIAAGVAALVAAAASPLPSGLGLICGALAGIVAAAMTDRRSPS